MCQIDMKETLYEGVMIDRCEECDGVWCDWGELGAIAKIREVTFTEEEKLEARETIGDDLSANLIHACPECGEIMEKFEYAVQTEIILDRCPHGCGLWLDPGELEKVQIVMEELEDRMLAEEKKLKTSDPESSHFVQWLGRLVGHKK